MEDFKEFAKMFGIPGAMLAVALLFLIRAISKGQFVSGREFDAMKADRDEWKSLALSSWTSAERLTNTTQTAVDHAAELTAAAKKA